MNVKKKMTFSCTVQSCSRELSIMHIVGRRQRSVLLQAIRHSTFFLPLLDFLPFDGHIAKPQTLVTHRDELSSLEMR